MQQNDVKKLNSFDKGMTFGFLLGLIAGWMVGFLIFVLNINTPLGG